jgi:8-oxo-dGTP pyrophosphatase MutT (NUDIX family)
VRPGVSRPSDRVSNGDHGLPTRRARVTALVAAHPAGDAREGLSREIILVEVGRLVDPFAEASDPTHLTASAVVAGRRGVVLHRHRRLHRWLQPGGHIEPGEEPEGTVVRECLEETGLPVDHPSGRPRLVHVDVHHAARGHVHLDLRYLVTAPDLPPAPKPGESQDVAWFSWEEADLLADEALAGALRSARRLARALGVPGAGPG